MSESKQAYYEKLVYNELMTHELVNYDRVLAKSKTLETLSDRQKNRIVSAYSDHNVLKKAFIVVIDLLKLVEGNDCVVMEGGTRNRVFHYVGERSDPLGNTNCRMIKDVKRYWELCQDSGGFFPEVWLDYFLKDTLNLHKLKERKRRPLVCVGLDRSLTHLEYLPNLYEAIKKRQVLKISYEERYGDRTELIFHPHLLKEYNGRWFILGVNEDGNYGKYSVDRIYSYCIVNGVDYVPMKEGEYKYWNQIIGVSHQEWTDVVHITLKTHSLYKHGLFVSKRFHESQHEVLAFGNHDGEEYGMLSIDIVPNKGQQILEASEDRNLTNIELLPFLYEAIKRKQVLAICYIHYTDSTKKELSLIVSPHYLKEFNGRWYLLGHTINNEGKVWRSHIALDRIVARPREISSGVTYVEPQAHYYENYFKNIVGVTHPNNAEVVNVHVRAHNHYMFMLTETKNTS